MVNVPWHVILLTPVIDDLVIHLAYLPYGTVCSLVYGKWRIQGGVRVQIKSGQENITIYIEV